MPLENPTVADIVDVLLDYPPEAPFKIDTAIPSCKEDVLTIDVDARGCVWVAGVPVQ